MLVRKVKNLNSLRPTTFFKKCQGGGSKAGNRVNFLIQFVRCECYIIELKKRVEIKYKNVYMKYKK